MVRNERGKRARLITQEETELIGPQIEKIIVAGLEAIMTAKIQISLIPPELKHSETCTTNRKACASAWTSSWTTFVAKLLLNPSNPTLLVTLPTAIRRSPFQGMSGICHSLAYAALEESQAISAEISIIKSVAEQIWQLYRH